MVRESIKTHGLIELLHNFGLSVLEMGESFNESQVDIILSKKEGIRTWGDFQKVVDEYAEDITGVPDQVNHRTAPLGEPEGHPGAK